MGNICRSPTAEGVFSSLVAEQNVTDQFIIDSAGTHAYHVGDVPDSRAQKAARDRGVDLSNQRARKVIMGDFEDYDFLLAMDDDNYKTLMSSCPDSYKQKIKYFLDFAPDLETKEVPDPYYGGKYGFERVLDMVDDASIGLLEYLQKTGQVR